MSTANKSNSQSDDTRFPPVAQPTLAPPKLAAQEFDSPLTLAGKQLNLMGGGSGAAYVDVADTLTAAVFALVIWEKTELTNVTLENGFLLNGSGGTLTNFTLEPGVYMLRLTAFTANAPCLAYFTGTDVAFS